DLLERRLAALVIASVDEDGRAFGGQPGGQGAAEPVRGAGDEDGLLVDGTHVLIVLGALADYPAVIACAGGARGTLFRPRVPCAAGRSGPWRAGGSVLCRACPQLRDRRT